MDTPSNPYPLAVYKVAVDVLITTTGDSPSATRLRDLWTWLGARDDGYRVDGVYRSPDSGALGSTVDALSVALASGGAISMLVSGIMEWVRNGRDRKRRNVPFTLTIKRAGVEVIIDTEVAQAWKPAELAEHIRQVATLLDEGQPGAGASDT
jgi:hypothetical protein